jgi:acyl carrier protein
MSSAVITSEQVERVIIDAMERFGPDLRGVSRESEFAARDVDSRDLAELAEIIDEEFAIKLEPPDMAGLRTVGDSIDLVVARAS